MSDKDLLKRFFLSGFLISVLLVLPASTQAVSDVQFSIPFSKINPYISLVKSKANSLEDKLFSLGQRIVATGEATLSNAQSKISSSLSSLGRSITTTGEAAALASTQTASALSETSVSFFNNLKNYVQELAAPPQEVIKSSSTPSTSPLSPSPSATNGEGLGTRLPDGQGGSAPPPQIITVRGPSGPAGPSGPPGPPGPPGPIGLTGTSNSYPAVIYTAPPAPAVNFSGASYFSATNLTSDQFRANLSNITTLAVSGNSTIAGSETVTGALSALTFNGQTITAGTGTLYGTATGSIASLQLLTSLSDETGSGSLVFATSPTLVTPTLGVATATSIAIGANILNTTEWANLDGLNQTLATTSNPTFAALTVTSCTGCSPTTSAALASAITDETGSGALVFANTPTLITPVLGAATGTSLALGGGTALTTTNQTGTGSLVLATSPTLVTPVLGIATGTSLATSAQNIFSATAGTAPLVIRSATATDDDLRLLPFTTGAARFAGIITTADLTADRTYTFGDASGTVYTTAAASITSAALLSSVSDETGTGLAVFATSPTLTTPNIGAATATTLTQSGNAIFSASHNVVANTSDASDNLVLSLVGGGATATNGSRGAQIAISGNEAGDAGRIVMFLGNAASSELQLFGNSGALKILGVTESNGAVAFGTTATNDAWVFNSTASNGAYLDIDRSGVDILRIGSAFAMGVGSSGDGIVYANSALYLSGTSINSTTVYNDTTATATNAVIENPGRFRRSTSSKRYKQDIVYMNLSDVKDVVMALRPVTYRGINETDSQRIWPGFIAEDVAEIAPILDTYDGGAGVMGGLPNYVMYDRIPAFLVPVIQDHELHLNLLAGTTPLTPESESLGHSLTGEAFVTSFFNNVYAKTKTWLADAGNGIGDFFANRVRTKEICVSDNSGAETCVDKNQLDALLIGSGGSSGASNGGAQPTPDSSAQGSGSPTEASAGEGENVPEPAPEPTPEPEPVP